MDNSKQTTNKKDWLRWIAVLPAAIAAFFVIQVLIGLVDRAYVGADQLQVDRPMLILARQLLAADYQVDRGE